MLRGTLAFFLYHTNESWGALLLARLFRCWDIPKKGKALANGMNGVGRAEGGNLGGSGDWILSP